MAGILSYLPQHPGYLPNWIFILAVTSFANCIQTYVSLVPTRRVYSRNPSAVTALSARTFGTWTFLSAIVRIYAAYHIEEKAWYDVAMWVFGGAWAHFVSEWLVFKTTQLGPGLYGPLVVSTSSLVWMFLQRDFYVK